jgi:hypothetical protein
MVAPRASHLAETVRCRRMTSVNDLSALTVVDDVIETIEFKFREMRTAAASQVQSW